MRTTLISLVALCVAGCQTDPGVPTAEVGVDMDANDIDLADATDDPQFTDSLHDVPGDPVQRDVPTDSERGDTLDAPETDTAVPDVPEPPCPADMVLVTGFCMDRHEAPNTPGLPPLVMMSLLDAMAWCEARGKRVCFDDEWTQACAGDEALAYPYGPDHRPGVCNDDKIWRSYDQAALNGWPSSASGPAVDSFSHQIEVARQTSPRGANHVESLYQGTAAGQTPGCAGPHEVFDLVGNAEEWTVRRDGGAANFHGALKGRYWAESRTCQSTVTTHGDSFRFYEIGFRCCRDR